MLKDQELKNRESYLLYKESELQQKEDKLQEAIAAHERILPLKNELEQRITKEQELIQKENYLKQLEEDLSKKEEEIRQQQRINIEKPSMHVIEQTRRSGALKGEDSSDRKQIVTSKTSDKQKEIYPCHVKPYINFFSGTEPVPKNESSFERWKVEIDRLRNSSVYPEYIVNQAMCNSLKGQARRVLFTLGPEATAEEIMRKLQIIFGNLASGQTVLQELYTAEQNDNESTSVWGIRLEEIYQRAVDKGFATNQQKDKIFRERFWRSLRSVELQNATSVHYHSSVSFEELR